MVQEETIEEDSGLCTPAMDEFPGIMTHRFLEEEATDEAKNYYLIYKISKYRDRRVSVFIIMGKI